MEKIKLPFSKTYSYITLYRDDFEKIFDDLSKISKNVTYRFFYEDAEYSLKNKDEIEKLEQKPIRVEINSISPHVKFSTDEYGAKLYSESQKMDDEYITKSIDELLEKRSNKFLNLVEKRILLIFALPALLAFLSFSSDYINFYPFIKVIAIIMFAFMVIGFFLMLLTKWITKIRLVMVYEHQSPGFLKRNKDEIIIGFIFFILGAIVGKLIK